ncbi:MAG: response regulator [Anaerovoracaceae bacterium]
MIFCVEDDSSIRDLVLYTLKNTGFEAEGFCDGSELFRALHEKKPELILLDIMLPGISGMEILKKLKENKETADIPVIMLTAKGSEFDKVIGLDSGADDYVTKPFGMMELISRVKAVIRRTAPKAAENRLVCGDISLDKEKHTVEVKGEVQQLTLKEFELLRVLMENKGIVLSRDALLERIWGYDFDGETRTVDVHIRTLRQKLGESGNAVETVRGVGYTVTEPK